MVPDDDTGRRRLCRAGVRRGGHRVRSLRLGPERRIRDQFRHRSATLNLALRARGLTATSWAVAVTGFLVRTFILGSVLNAHLTRRSSSEWKLMTAARPPGVKTS